VTDLEILPGLCATPDRFLFHVPTRTAILSDLHLGFEAAAHASGNALPERTSGALRAAWQRVLVRAPAEIIIAGDVFEKSAPDAAAVALLQEVLALTPASCVLTVLPGNHDAPLASFARLLNGTRATVTERAVRPAFTVAHGDQLRELGRPPLLVIGHQHPAVILRDRLQQAKMLCFAAVDAGAFGFPVVILPPFSPVPLGSNLLTSRNWAVDLREPDPARVRIAGIVRDAVLDFGPLAGLL
jgi:putative SbcD/Mre11-related phosphoesterase